MSAGGAAGGRRSGSLEINYALINADALDEGFRKGGALIQNNLIPRTQRENQGGLVGLRVEFRSGVEGVDLLGPDAVGVLGIQDGQSDDDGCDPAQTICVEFLLEFGVFEKLRGTLRAGVRLFEQANFHSDDVFREGLEVIVFGLLAGNDAREGPDQGGGWRGDGVGFAQGDCDVGHGRAVRSANPGKRTSVTLEVELPVGFADPVADEGVGTAFLFFEAWRESGCL